MVQILATPEDREDCRPAIGVYYHNGDHSDMCAILSYPSFFEETILDKISFDAHIGTNAAYMERCTRCELFCWVEKPAPIYKVLLLNDSLFTGNSVPLHELCVDTHSYCACCINALTDHKVIFCVTPEQAYRIFEWDSESGCYMYKYFEPNRRFMYTKSASKI